MSRNVVLGIVMGVMAVVVGGFAMRGAMTTNETFAVAMEGQARCKVYGELVTDSIRPLHGAVKVAFQMREPETGTLLNVVYDNPASALPANFPAAQHAQLAGYYDPVQQQFITNQVQTKCPSKYEAGELDLAQENALTKWRDELARSGGPPPSQPADRS